MTNKGNLKRVLRMIGTGGVLASIACSVSVSVAASAPQAPTVKTVKHQKAAQKRLTREMVTEAQQRLVDLGYWVGQADGKWREGSRQGLVAFQKVERRPLTGRLTINELQALRSASRPTPRDASYAHIEVDLNRQVLFFIENGGIVSRILPVSTGSGELYTLDDYTQPAVTPTGRFRVYRKVPGWRKSKLGMLYYPNYLVGGIAIHGNQAVPTQPKSHGCIRIPMFAAVEFSEITPLGTEVIVYNDGAIKAINQKTR
jgi:lipoprotein-anchoring transpeptidase ErfK/SrfK